MNSFIRFFLFLWLFTSLLGAFILSIVQQEFSILYIYWDLAGYSLLCSFLGCYIISILIWRKNLKNIITIFTIGFLICYVSFVCVYSLLKNSIQFNFYHNEKLLMVFVIYVCVFLVGIFVIKFSRKK